MDKIKQNVKSIPFTEASEPCTNLTIYVTYECKRHDDNTLKMKEEFNPNAMKAKTFKLKTGLSTCPPVTNPLLLSASSISKCCIEKSSLAANSIENIKR